MTPEATRPPSLFEQDLNMLRWLIEPFLANPFLPAFLLLWATTAALWRRRPRLKRRRCWLAGAVILLSLCCMPWVSYLALQTLEAGYEPYVEVPEDVDAMVVLSGGLRLLDEEGRHYELQGDTMGRCVYALSLHRQDTDCPILVTGGAGTYDRPGPAFATAMAEFFEKAGVEPALLIVEDESRNTRQNAVLSKPLLEARGVGKILLVTDATHMHRATLCFRKVGFEVVPAACNFRTSYFRWNLFSFLPSAGAASGLGAAMHEWLGLVWYWLHGWI
jgi:uncharacterized SAM-binding protein YcdF (DUF218 family)